MMLFKCAAGCSEILSVSIHTQLFKKAVDIFCLQLLLGKKEKRILSTLTKRPKNVCDSINST